MFSAVSFAFPRISESDVLEGCSYDSSVTVKQSRPGRLVPKKGYIGTVSTKTHSGDPDSTGGSAVFANF